MKLLRTLFILPVLATLSAFAQVETYKIDPVHSSVSFGVRHFFTKVPGSFAKFSGTISVDRADLEKSSTQAAIEVSSVDTQNAKRDGHLASPDFFQTATFPAITFKSTAWKKTGEKTYDVTGDLTLKGVTKPVTLKVTSLGFGPGNGNAQLSGWEGTTTLNRKDFGITYGEGIVGAEVEVSINIEAILQK